MATSGAEMSHVGHVMPDAPVSCVTCKRQYNRVRLPGGSWAPTDCPHCHPTDPRHAAGGAAVAASEESHVLEVLADAGVNVRKYGRATLDAFDPSDDPEALQQAHHYVSAWSTGRWDQRDWMYLYGAGSERENGRVRIGQLGNGKTFLAVAIARALIEAGKLRRGRLRFATAETLLLETEATFRDGSTDSEVALMRRLGALDLLIIDDVGVRMEASAHAVRVLDEVAKRREANGLIWTSNVSLPVLAGEGDAWRRIVDRIAGEAGDGARYVIGFTGPSRRRQRSRKGSKA